MSVGEEVEILSVLLTVDLCSVLFLTKLLSVESVLVVSVGFVAVIIFNIDATYSYCRLTTNTKSCRVDNNWRWDVS